MAIKTYRPITPTLRFQTSLVNDDLTTNKPHKPLLTTRKRTGGRRNQGDLTMRHQGGGHKQKIRLIDFKRDKFGVPGKVATIEYDPNRSARIALLHYTDGEKRYILAPDSLKVGESLMSGPQAEIKTGNAMPLANVPVGTFVHNVELRPGKGGQLGRSAGASIQIMAKEGKFVQLRLPSGEVRNVPQDCYATVGMVSNADHENVSVGKAGRSRWLGIRPQSRGVVQNPVDHPHGGGEGKSPQGNPHPVSPWGWHTKGKKTRHHKLQSNKYIVKRRK